MPFTMSGREKDVLANIIEIYKEMPYLWQKEHKDYKNNDKRTEGFKVLLEIYKSFDEKATIKTVKRKIENMRTNYAKELKKVVSSKQTGAGTEEVYIPSLWYFEAFSFLGCRTESCRVVTDSLLDQNLSSSDEDGEKEGITGSGTQKRKKKDESLIQKQAKLLDAANKMMCQKDEEWEVFGRSIGFQMKDLDKRQLIIAQKIISDVIFYAKLNKLSEESYVVTTPSEENKSRDLSFYERQTQFYSPSPPLSYYSSPSPHQFRSPYHPSLSPSPHQSQSPHHPSPSPSPHRSQSPHHPSPSPSPHRSQSPHHPSPSPSPHQSQSSHHPSPSPSPSPHRSQSPHHPSPSPQNYQFSPVVSLWPRYRIKSICKPLQSPQRQIQLLHVTSPNLINETSTEQSSSSRQRSPNLQINTNRSNHQPSPLQNVQEQAYHSTDQPSTSFQSSPNAQIQAQYSSAKQSLPSDDIRVVNDTEELLNFIGKENSSDTNLPCVTEGPGYVMKEFLIMKSKK